MFVKKIHSEIEKIKDLAAEIRQTIVEIEEKETPVTLVEYISLVEIDESARSIIYMLDEHDKRGADGFRSGTSPMENIKARKLTGRSGEDTSERMRQRLS